MAKSKYDSNLLLVKGLDLLNTLIAHPLVGVGAFALITYPIEDWWRETHPDPGIKNPIAALREIILAAALTDAALGSMIPAIKGMGHAALMSGKTGPSVVESLFLL